MLIEGSKFTIRTWKKTDMAALQKHADNRNVSGFLLDRFPHPYTLADAGAFINSKLSQNPVVNFAIEINGEVAGGIGLEFRQDVYRKTPLIGYWLSEQHWGQGIMPEAVQLITNYAFEQLDVICILAFVLSRNPKSMRVLEKAGFEQQGIIKQSVIKDGVVMDEHVYGINKESRV
ncbi:GNAT family N-acetyltransferase [Mucilaginibacter agri]|uniref:GNAT family N-acetyltransferase n=1 Tax=Mucilaginibacter agri TaxID=2695265 RepID=A0A965ZGG9_9SPHI|nr:GNAT family protein [Mucilaginibacter agri]NCD69316.1 GNAT family N-acetyltransferase [Mucilaginibacter agri]